MFIENRTKFKTNCLILVFFLLLNFATTGGHTDAFDGVTYFLFTENLALHHSLKFHSDLPSASKLNFDMRQFASVSLGRLGISLSNNQTIPEFYTPSAVLLSAIAVPFYEIATSLSVAPYVFITFILNPLIISATGLMIFLFAKKVYKSQKIGFASAILFSFTSFVWPYNSSFFTNPLVGLLIISSLYFLYKGIKTSAKFSIELSAFFLGLVVLAHPGYVFLIPIVLAYGIYHLRKNKTKLLKFIVICLLVLSIQGLINHERTGSFTNFAYGQEESLTEDHKDWIGLVGLLLSPGKGDFIYYPLSILFPISFYLFYKKKMSIGILFYILFFVSYFFFGTINDPNWGSLGSWGPRYLVPLVPLISVALGNLLTLKSKLVKTAIICLGVLGFAINLLGKLIWYQYGLSYGWGHEALWKVDSGHVITWTWQYSPIALQYGALTSDYLPNVKITNTLGDYHIIGLIPCKVDLFLYCKDGFLVPFILIMIAAIVFYFVWKEIKFEKIFSEN